MLNDNRKGVGVLSVSGSNCLVRSLKDETLTNKSHGCLDPQSSRLQVMAKACSVLTMFKHAKAPHLSV
eukprot:6455800-Amphidinium_carterae.1